MFHMKQKSNQVGERKQKVGAIGEKLASRFLAENGFVIIDRNYRKKWGEIDIVAEKNNVLHFVEVKAITSKWDYMPEDNVRLWKKLRLSRAIRIYFAEKRIPDETEFQIDIVAVFLDFERKKARMRMLENVILNER